jgi:hypothetical protein
MSEELVNAVARAIYKADLDPSKPRWERLTHLTQELMREEARAALQAIESSGTHVVVPVEPTGEMGQAGENLDLVGLGSRPVYEAMIAARPKVTP